MSQLIRNLRRDPALAAAVLALVMGILLYAPTIARGLVDYDDAYLIRDNWVLHDLSWSTIHTVFFDLSSAKRFTLSPEYLPIRDLSTMIDLAIWGDWYPGHHLTNLALYVAAIWIWFRALVTFGIERSIAGLAILLWAVHPSHAESVAWLAERKGLLAAMFSGAAALGYARFRAGKHAAWLGGAMLAGIAAVWSKAPAAFALAALAGLELALPAARMSWRRSLVGLAGIAITAGLAFVPVLMLATTASVVDASAELPAARGAMVVGAHGFYLLRGAMVERNAISYPIATDGPSVIEIVVGGVGFLAIAFVLFAPRARRWIPLRAACVIWFVTWIPIGHAILPLKMVVVADRYLLVPSLGFALALAAGIAAVPSTRARWALLAVIVLAASVRTLDAQSNWRDATTLWHRAVTSNPRDGVAWAAYAEALVEQGNASGAAEVTARGLQQSRAPRLLLRKALLLLANNNRPAGVRSMHEAAKAGEPRAMSNVALLLLEDGRIDEALAWARQGFARMPMYPPAARAAGRVALAAGHADEAAVAFVRALELEPSCTNRYNASLALVALGRIAEATPLLEPCIADPILGLRVRETLSKIGSR